ncbi:hypothetical protein BJ912DRAFT_480381 [Pholiota molesta]|nr:hypothetical protein BJ912DRAFT_480381 [Pholiota molesta]
MYKILEVVRKFKTTWSSSNEERYTPLSICHPTTGDVCALCQEATTLGIQIRQLEDDLAILRAKQSSNKAKINTAHDALSRLPIELVSNIFMYLQPLPIDPAYCVDMSDPDDVATNIKNMRDIRNPLVLGAVCRAWRALAWSIRQLWTTVSVDVFNYNENAPEMVRQWLSRSGQLPLSIYFYAARIRIYDGILMPPPFIHETYVQRLMDVINAQSRRWFYLNFNVPKRFMHRLDCSGLEAPMLEILTLQNANDHIEDVIHYSVNAQVGFGKTPRLRKVYIFDGLVSDDLKVNWEGVTHVESTFFTVEMAYVLLREAPFLTHFHVEVLIDAQEDELEEVLRHDHLTSFQIKDTRDFDDGAHILLPFLVLPALEEFGICTNVIVRLYIVDDLLRRSSCILKTFRVNITARWMECKKELIALLETIPSVEILHLECHYGLYNNMSPIPSQFPPPEIVQEMDALNARILFPNVKTVHIKTGYEKAWSCTLELGLHPHGRGDLIDTRPDIIPWNSVRLKPLFIYYLLDPASQQAIQPAIEGGFCSTFPPANIHPFMGFLFLTLYRCLYNAGEKIDAHRLPSDYFVKD